MRRLGLFLVVGLILGLAAGVYYGWQIDPVRLTDGEISNLAPRFKDDYVIMVANGYQLDADLTEAVNRLKPLGVNNVFTYVRDLTERYISEAGQGNEANIRSLVALSCAMGYCTGPMQRFLSPTG